MKKILLALIASAAFVSVALADDVASRFASVAERGKKQADQRRDNRDHDQ